MKKDVGGVDKKIPDVSDIVKATAWNTKITAKTETVTQRFPRKRCSENMQQIYRRTPASKIDFNKVASNFIETALRHGCSPVNLLHIFRTAFIKNTSGVILKLVKLKRNNFNLIIITSMLLLKN